MAISDAISESLNRTQEVVDYIWSGKYKDEADTSFDGALEKQANIPDKESTLWRLAWGAAQAENNPEYWAPIFYELLKVFLSGGRIINSLGTKRPKTTSMNCFVSQVIEDSIDGIFDTITKAAKTMQAGGGVGFDWSTLRPKGAPVKGVGATSSGTLSFMKVADTMCQTIASSGHRRGAMMAVMRVDHPDIEEFIKAKRGEENQAFQNFNFSVAVTDDFMEAVKEGRKWNLVFGGKVYKTLPARELWDIILTHSYNYAEPGLLFIDRINKMNNLYYSETIYSTNPCGEQPLPPNGACNLGSLNLTKFVVDPFGKDACFEYDAFESATRLAVRFLDDVADVARLPLPEQKEEVRAKRRVGLGITGLADALWMLGLQYGTHEAIDFCRNLAQMMRDAAYRASVDLAKEKGPFPVFDAEKYLGGEFVKKLPEDIKESIRTHGIRNSHLLTIAPTGTTSLLWGNISSGVEPILDITVDRKIKESDGKEKVVIIDDYAYLLWKQLSGNGKKPDVTIADDISAKGHIDMMAAWQEFFDASISKTITFAEDTSFEEFRNTYQCAYDNGLKGCTVFRKGSKIGAVIKGRGDGYVKPMSLPDVRVKNCIKVEIPREGANSEQYELEVTVMENAPREVWMHAPEEQTIAEMFEAICRLVSIGLRCNVDPNVLLKQLKKSIRQYGYVSSPLAIFMRGFMKVVGMTGMKMDSGESAVCPECGAPLVFEGSCVHCSSCTYDRCG